jgi:hypothetical protein
MIACEFYREVCLEKCEEVPCRTRALLATPGRKRYVRGSLTGTGNLHWVRLERGELARADQKRAMTF